MASWKGKPIELTATEFKLLTILAQRPAGCSRATNCCATCGNTTALIDTRTVDTHMRRLREKMGPAAGSWKRCAAWDIGFVEEKTTAPRGAAKPHTPCGGTWQLFPLAAGLDWLATPATRQKREEEMAALRRSWPKKSRAPVARDGAADREPSRSRRSSTA